MSTQNYAPYKPEQKAALLKAIGALVAGGLSAAKACIQAGISESTYRKWLADASGTPRKKQVRSYSNVKQPTALEYVSALRRPELPKLLHWGDWA